MTNGPLLFQGIGDDPEPAPYIEDDDAAPNPAVVGTKPCKEPGCTNFVDPSAHRATRYCPEHFKGSTHKKGSDSGKDKLPPSIKIEVNAAKAAGKNPTLDAVEERARQIAQTMAALLVLVQQPEDAADIANGADGWAKAVRELAVYEEWLQKLSAGEQATGRTLAWGNVLMLTGAMVLPILIRHEALPAKISGVAQNVLNIADGGAVVIDANPAA
jgi:hypothetical protein